MKQKNRTGKIQRLNSFGKMQFIPKFMRNFAE